MATGHLRVGSLEVDNRSLEVWINDEVIPSTEFRILHMQHRIPNGTGSGTLTAGAWQDRPINYVEKNTIDGASLNPVTYMFTLPAGKYRVFSSLMGFYTNSFLSRLYNVTDLTVTEIGSFGMSHPEGGYNNSSSDIYKEFEITSAKIFKFQMYAQTTRLNDGFGYRSNTLDGSDGIFANVIIQDVNSTRGAKGDTGGAGTIAIGNVIAGESPTSASITNTGTATEAVLDITLPKGDPGTTVPDMTSLTYIDSVDFDNDKVLIYDESSQSHKVTNPNNIVKPEPQQGVKKLIAETHYGGNGVLTFTNDVLTWGQKYGGGLCALFDGVPTTDGTYQPGYLLQKPAGETGTIVDVDMWTHGGCALYTTGNFYTSGFNNNGGLGLGNTTSQSMLTLSNTNVVEYARPTKLSHEHNGWRLFVKKTDGYWYGAGQNASGALGIGNTTQQNSWVQLTSLGTDVKKVYNLGATYGCTIVEKEDGSIWAAGQNNNGQLGIGNTTNQTSFVNITSHWGILNTFGERVLDVQGGFGYASTVAYNENVLFMLISDNGVAGRIRGAGFNSHGGTLGDGTTTQRISPVAPLHNSNTIKSLHIAGGGPCSVYALESNGTMWVNGYNAFGQLGDGTTTGRHTPLIRTFDSPIRKIFANAHAHNYSYNNQAFVQLEDGRIYGTGNNASGQLGDGTYTQRTTWTLIPYDFTKYGFIKEVKWNGFDEGGMYLTWLTESGYIFGTGYNVRRGLSINNFQNINYSSLQRLDIGSITHKKGDRGQPGLNADVIWDATKSYEVNAPVFYLGDPYKSLQADNVNKIPSEESAWWQITGGSGGEETNSSPGYVFENGQFDENLLEGWSTYSDTPNTIPVDGYGVGANITLTLDSTTPLIGSGSGVITKDAVNRQGQGISYDFSVDRGVLQNPCKITFEYETSANYADNDIGVYVYDKTNNVLLYPSVVNLPATLGNPASHVAVLLLNSTSTEYRLVFHVQSTSALAYTMKLDNVQVGNQSVAVGAAISEWRSFTPTWTNVNLGTGGVAYASWRRVGKNMEINAGFILGTGGNVSGFINLSLPSGYNIDEAGLRISYNRLGIAHAYDSDAGQFKAGEVVQNVNSDSLVFGMHGNGYATSTSPMTWTVGDEFGINASVPISQWTSNINLASDFTEYASNSSATDANDTTSFVYGRDGSTGILGVTNLTAARSKRVRFSRAIQETDIIVVELYRNGAWGSINEMKAGGLFSIQSLSYDHNNITVGLAWEVVSGSATDVDVTFGVYPETGTGVIQWKGIVGKWRVRKISNGNMAEQIKQVYMDRVVDSTTTKELVDLGAGIIESGSNSNGSYVKFSDGTLIQRGHHQQQSGATPNYWLAVEMLQTGTGHQGYGHVSVSIIPYGSNAARVDQCYLSSANFTCYQISPSTTNVITYHAIGRWK